VEQRPIRRIARARLMRGGTSIRPGWRESRDGSNPAASSPFSERA